MVDALVNFGYSTVLTAPSPATSGLTVTVQSGDGSKFPTAPFDITLYAPGNLPLISTAEIARCTAVSGDTLTITRAQYGTTAQTVATGWIVDNAVTANLLSQIIANSAQNGYNQLIRTLGPAGWWKLNDPVGSTTAFDSSNNNLTGTVTGTATFGQSALIPGQPTDTGVLLAAGNGNNNSIEVPIPAATLTAFTVTMAVNGSTWDNTPSNEDYLFAAGSTTNGFGIFGENDGLIFGYVNIGGTQYYNAPNVTYNSGTNYISLVYSGSAGTLKTYLNGALVSTLTGLASSISFPGNLYIGGTASQGSWYRGPLTIGNFAYFTTALSAAQISALYNAAPNSPAKWALPIEENVAGKNFIANGAMEVWQRGTSFSAAVLSATGYTADRWAVDASASGWTVSKVSSPGLTGFQYALRVQRNSGNTSTGQCDLAQSLESVDSIPLAGQTVTLSFYARAGANYSPTSSLLTMNLVYGTGTDQSVLGGFTGSTNVITGTPTLTTSWQRFSYTGTVPTNATQLGIFGYMTPTGTAGANDYFDITGVQLEVGSSASNFTRRAGSYQQELALCQRYYYLTGGQQPYQTFGIGVYTGANGFFCSVALPVAMRTGPSFTSSAASNFAIAGAAVKIPSALGLDDAGLTNVGLSITVSGATAGQAGLLQANDTLSAYLAFSAEL